MKIITEQMIEGFTSFLIEDEKSENTIKKYVRDIKAFSVWMKGGEATKQKILEYKRRLCEKYSESSVNSIISSLNSFFDYLNWYNLRVKSVKIQKQIFANKEREITKDEYRKILDAALRNKNKRMYFLIQTICNTGIRISELKFITVEAVKSGRAIINCKGKIRIVILTEELCKLLKSYISEKKIKSGSVFITKSGRPLDRSNIWSELKKLSEIAGVSGKKVFPHNFRHLFARTFYSVSKDIVRLADVLGHSNVNTTRIYIMETWEMHRRQLQKLDLLCNEKVTT